MIRIHSIRLSTICLHFLTLKTLIASSHMCIPRDSNTSTHPKYFTGNEHVDDRTACSSVGHCGGLLDSGTRSFRRRNESRNERRIRSILFGDDLLLNRNDANFCIEKKLRNIFDLLYSLAVLFDYLF